MHREFSDITNRIASPPAWWDENGTPRWGEPHPQAAPNLYIDEAALVEVGCQCCDVRWSVLMTSSEIGRRLHARACGSESIPSLRARIEDGSIGYGDPPNYGHECAAGATMTSNALRVLAYWRKGGRADGKRWTEWIDVPELRRDLPDLAIEIGEG